jgi:hypothetical protein
MPFSHWKTILCQEYSSRTIYVKLTYIEFLQTSLRKLDNKQTNDVTTVKNT